MKKIEPYGYARIIVVYRVTFIFLALHGQRVVESETAQSASSVWHHALRNTKNVNGVLVPIQLGVIHSLGT